MADPVAGEPADVLDLSATRRVHVTNVGGAGMSAIAIVLAQRGLEVSGHDPAADTPFVGPLREVGVRVATGPDRPPLGAAVDAVVTSTATPADDPDVVAARASGVPVVHRRAVLAALSAERVTAAVAGTHGKTTTAAMLATVLHEAGTDPGWIVGARIAGLGTSAAWGGDGPFVVEGDESDGSFLALAARAAVVTNVEPDHLEHWGSEAALVAGFERFVAATDGPVVLCADDPGAAALADAASDVRTYGTGRAGEPGPDYRVEAVTTTGTGVRFRLTHAGEQVEVAVPSAPGAHNAANAAGALAVAHGLGVPLTRGAEALGGFRGVARRFELRGEAAGVTLVDSYDHLPTEVAAAMAAARAGGWRRVVCAFQPHRFSRTESLGATFADAFVDADLLVLTDVYAAGEAPRAGVTGEIVLRAVLDRHPRARVAYLPRLDDVVGYLATELRPGDLCLTLGAGDLTTVPDRVLERLAGRAGAPMAPDVPAGERAGEVAEP